MKNLFLAVTLISAMAAFAQDDRENQLTPAQRTELQVKKMTLDLDLNSTQQKEMTKIIGEQNEKREAARQERKAQRDSGKRPTSEERFDMQSKMLDDQIAMKERMRKILNAEQYAKWESNREHKRIKMKKDMRERKYGKAAKRK